MQLPRATGLVSLLTDFGTVDPYVGVMKGVMKSHFAAVDIVDLCHELPPQSVAIGGLYLAAALPYFGDGTVHTVVVDPGVGTTRRVLAVCAQGCFAVGPDNGVLTPILPTSPDQGEVRAVDTDALGLVARSETFHGRDVFAPVAAMLAAGRYGFRALGPRITDPVDLDVVRRPPAAVLAVDHFGNLITGIGAADLRGDAVEISGREIAVRRTYADVAPGEFVALINSYELVEIAVRDGSAANTLGAGPGEAVRLL